MRRMRMVVVGAAAALMLTAIVATPPGNADPDGQQYAINTMFIQQAGGEPVLCIGGVLTSLPPQCGGPTIIGMNWDDVAGAESEGGATWGGGWAVGTWDRAANTFTFTQAPSSQPPAGVVVPTPESYSFPPLCDDPYAGVDPDAGQIGTIDTVQTAAAALDGYVGAYVSDGFDDLNVLVTGDADAALAQLRAEYSGWLCVATSAGATAADIAAAQQAVMSQLGGDVISAGGDAGGILTVGVMLADEQTVARVMDAVAPWLTPDQVSISGQLLPVG